MNLSARIDRVVAEKSLLAHPFYRAWSEGTLAPSALRHYAKQYFAFESRFPRFLSSIHAREERAEVRAGLLDNLWDEEHGTENHAELWLRFAESLGLSRDEVKSAVPTAATRALVETYMRTSRDGGEDTSAGLAAIYAYESQFADVADAKFVGLQKHPHQTGTDLAPTDRDLAFFKVHRHVDVAHAEVGRQALDTSDGSSHDAALAAADAACEAWNAFLSDALAHAN